MTPVKTDFLGREWFCDPEEVRRLVDALDCMFAGKNVFVVMSALETVAGNIICQTAKNIEHAHSGVDSVTKDIKAYVTLRMAANGDSAGHA